ncbi:MAG: type II secretion system protein [bacterium]
MIRDRNGFTLVELLITMLIVGLSTPLLMGAIIGSLKITREQSQNRSAATGWIQGEVEFLRRQCYADLAAMTWPRKVTNTTLAGEPSLPSVAEGRYVAAPDAGYVEVAPDGPARLRMTVTYYKNDWGPGPTPTPRPGPTTAADAATTTYLTEMYTGRCPP